MKFALLSTLIFYFSYHSYSQNLNISNGNIFDGEPYLVIDPSNSQHLVAAWMGFQLGQKTTIKTSYSNNGGSSWSTPIWQTHEVAGNTSADVSLGYDLNGNLYMAYVDYDNVNFSNGGIILRKSINGGISWGTSVEVADISDCPSKLCLDRPWMAIDRSGGSYDGTVYITSMNADQPTLVSPPYNPYLWVSTDFGNSFLNPRFLDTLNFYAGSTITQPMPSPSVSSSGVFYAVYPSYEPINQGPFAHLFLAKSTNAGLSVTQNNVYTSSGGGVSNPLVKKGSLLKCDPSDALHMAFFYLNEINGDADIYMIESFDTGIIWSTPKRINQDPISNGKIQDLVWADFDTDGDLAVCWRDRRNAAGNTYQQPTEIFGAVRWKDSVQFSADFMISDIQAPHNVILEGSGNDFMNVNFLNDTIYAVWGDVRTGVLSIYLNKYGVTSNTNSISVISQQLIPSLTLFPNPSSEKIQLKDAIKYDSFQIINHAGEQVLNGITFPENGINIENYSKGNYYIYFNFQGKIQMATFNVN